MKKKELTYRFHNPNPERALEDYIQKIVIYNGVRDIFAILKNQEQKEGKAADEHCSLLQSIYG